MTYLTRSPISLDALLAEVSSPACGGTCVFLGTVRNGPDEHGVTAIEYSAYEEMVEAEFGRLLADARARWPEARIAVRHRLGTIPVGEASIAIVTAAPHRAQAFEACRYVIEEVKRRVPVWKKELRVDGTEVWVDPFGRPLASLRVSVTDRCNMRCRYCMPEDEYVWLPRESILTFEEIARLVGVFAGLGVHKVRLTGGEPLLRHDLPKLVEMIARDARITDLAMTTNGLLLAKHAAALHQAGLQRLTVSLDTLHPERMLAFAKSERHGDVLAGIAAARAAGYDR